jgi:hypothetical protein
MLEVRPVKNIMKFSPCESGEYIRLMGCGIESDFLFTGEENLRNNNRVLCFVIVSRPDGQGSPSSIVG